LRTDGEKAVGNKRDSDDFLTGERGCGTQRGGEERRGEARCAAEQLLWFMDGQ
jgi:hypothetical protein